MIAPILLMLMADAGITTFTDGHDLAGLCRVNRPACTRYVVGASDMISGLEVEKSLPAMICVGGNVTEAQLTDVVDRFLAANPDSLTQGAGQLIWAALYGSFPCPSNGQ